MKQLKVIGIMVGAVVLLTGSYLLVNARTEKREKQAAAESAPVQLVSFDRDLASKMLITNEEGEFAFTYADGTWELDSQEFEINAYAVSTVCNYMSNVSSLKTVEKDCENLSKYGLDKPITVTVTTSDGNTYTLLVGDPTPTNESFYVMLPDQDAVYTIDYDTGAVFCVSRDTLKDLYLFNVNSTEVTHFALKRDGATIFNLDHTNEVENAWKMNAPITADANSATLSDTLDGFVRVTVATHIAEHPDNLATYGLDKPKYEVEVSTASKTRSIAFGNMISANDDERYIYGYFTDTKQVFTIDKEALGFLEAKTVDYLYPYIYTPEISNIKTVDVQCLDTKTKLEIDYSAEKFVVDGTTFASDDEDGMQYFYNLYRSIAMLEISDLNPDAVPDTTKEAVATITYTMQDASQVVITLLPASDTTYYVMKDGVYTQLMTRKRYLTDTGSITQRYNELQKYLKK